MLWDTTKVHGKVFRSKICHWNVHLEDISTLNEADGQIRHDCHSTQLMKSPLKYPLKSSLGFNCSRKRTTTKPLSNTILTVTLGQAIMNIIIGSLGWAWASPTDMHKDMYISVRIEWCYAYHKSTLRKLTSFDKCDWSIWNSILHFWATNLKFTLMDCSWVNFKITEQEISHSTRLLLDGYTKDGEHSQTYSFSGYSYEYYHAVCSPVTSAVGD